MSLTTSFFLMMLILSMEVFIEGNRSLLVYLCANVCLEATNNVQRWWNVFLSLMVSSAR
jgi:hypothetical protein